MKTLRKPSSPSKALQQQETSQEAKKKNIQEAQLFFKPSNC
jgi:hypothetical protein